MINAVMKEKASNLTVKQVKSSQVAFNSL